MKKLTIVVFCIYFLWTGVCLAERASSLNINLQLSDSDGKISHSGRTDRNGGHYDRKTGRYHRH